LNIQQQQQQPQLHRRRRRRRQKQQPLPAAAGRRDTLQPAPDATWRPEIIYGRFRVMTATPGCSCCHNDQMLADFQNSFSKSLRNDEDKAFIDIFCT